MQNMRISYHNSFHYFVICVLNWKFEFEIDGWIEWIKWHKILIHSGWQLTTNNQQPTTSENCANKMNKSICHKSPQSVTLHCIHTKMCNSLNTLIQCSPFHSMFRHQPFPNIFTLKVFESVVLSIKWFCTITANHNKYFTFASLSALHKLQKYNSVLSLSAVSSQHLVFCLR